MGEEAKWDSRYAEQEYIFGTEPNVFLAAQSHRIPPGPVLSLGDGEGRNGVHLATLGYQVTAVDASSVGLAKSLRLAESRGVPIRTVHADLADFVIAEGVWSGIVCIFCHLSPALRARVHAASVRGLRPGGVFIVEAYTPDHLLVGTGGPRDPDLLVRCDDLVRELAGLEMAHCEELRRPRREGSRHTGEAAVVQAVAVKP